MLHHCDLWGRSFVPYGPSSRPSLPIPGCSHGFYRLVRTLKSSSSYDLWRGIRFSTRHFYPTARPAHRVSWMGGRSFRRDLCRVIALAAPRLRLCGCPKNDKTFVRSPRPGALITAGEINMGKLGGATAQKGYDTWTVKQLLHG